MVPIYPFQRKILHQKTEKTKKRNVWDFFSTSACHNSAKVISRGYQSIVTVDSRILIGSRLICSKCLSSIGMVMFPQRFRTCAIDPHQKSVCSHQSTNTSWNPAKLSINRLSHNATGQPWQAAAATSPNHASTIPNLPEFCQPSEKKQHNSRSFWLWCFPLRHNQCIGGIPIDQRYQWPAPYILPMQ